MSERLVLVDSSAWIRYLSDRGSAHAHSIGKLLADHRVAINPVIRVELLTGAKDERQYAQLEDAFEGLHALDVTDPVWKRAERLRFELRRSGHLVPVPDAVIACCAVIYGCGLLHADRHFERIAQAIGLKIHPPA
ncbi:MAG: PIN domain-containing protein [Candidatus Omnitrophica bacterium]|nr:PIN domain-containing protein [Candidatus Omnitrophota bacterium]